MYGWGGYFSVPGRPSNPDNSRAYYACKWWGKRGAVVEWLERCGYGAESRRKVVSSRLGFAIRLWENFFCQPSSKWVTFANQGKIRQQKERDGLRLSFAVPMIQRNSNPTAPTAIRLWETFTLTFRWGLFGVFFFLLIMVSLVPSISLLGEAG